MVKSYKKSLHDTNNYRGISLIPILTKTLELVILEKCPELKEHSPSQFGFTSSTSTVHPEILLQDTIHHYNGQDSPVYICSLDAEKAFDTCNWFELFKKIEKKGSIPSTVTRFLIKLYLGKAINQSSSIQPVYGRPDYNLLTN